MFEEKMDRPELDGSVRGTLGKTAAKEKSKQDGRLINASPFGFMASFLPLFSKLVGAAASQGTEVMNVKIPR